MRTLENELLRFKNFESKFKNNKYFSFEQVDDFVYALKLKKQKQYTIPLHKKWPLSLFGLVHGNEVAGAAVLNEVLESIHSGLVQPQIDILFALGNPRAGLGGARFLEEDLNRCFGGSLKDSLERRRAVVLESVLADTCYLIDFHQTQVKCEGPFFALTSNHKNLQFSSDLDEEGIIVNTTANAFARIEDKSRMCADEYIHEVGGIGVTYELGEKGMDPCQIAHGLSMAIRGIKVVTDYFGLQSSYSPMAITAPEADVSIFSKFHGQIYTQNMVIRNEEEGADLDSHWYNFERVYKDQRIGASFRGTIYSPLNGRMIFPKFKSGAQKVKADKGEPLCTIICPVSSLDFFKRSLA